MSLERLLASDGHGALNPASGLAIGRTAACVDAACRARLAVWLGCNVVDEGMTMVDDDRGGFVRGTGKLSKMLADPEKNELAALIRQALVAGGDPAEAKTSKQPPRQTGDQVRRA